VDRKLFKCLLVLYHRIFNIFLLLYIYVGIHNLYYKLLFFTNRKLLITLTTHSKDKPIIIPWRLAMILVAYVTAPFAF